jgi:hypothetical protein
MKASGIIRRKLPRGLARPPLQADRIALEALDRREFAVAALKMILRFRNAETGAGMFQAANGGSYKLCVGERNALMTNLFTLGKCVKNNTRLSPRARMLFARAEKNIRSVNEGIDRWISPRIRRIISAEIERNYPDSKETLACYTDPVFRAAVYAKIKIYEQTTLSHLRLIDEQIDVLLRLFNLNKASVLPDT